MLNWLRAHPFEAYLVSFLLMMLAPIGLYYAAQGGHEGWIWCLLGLVATGNLLAIAIR